MTRSRLVLAALLATPSLAAAQVGDTTAPPVDSVVVEGVSPRGAFIRSMILPGWGQASFDAYIRGGIYFAGWAGNWFMIFKTVTKLEEAGSRFDLRAEQIETALIADAPDPDSMRAVLDSVPSVLTAAIEADSLGNELRKLVRARDRQREDWIAWAIFWILASGIDGYVTAHLSDFPAAIEVEPNADRSVTLRVEVPLGRRRP